RIGSPASVHAYALSLARAIRLYHLATRQDPKADAEDRLVPQAYRFLIFEPMFADKERCPGPGERTRNSERDGLSAGERRIRNSSSVPGRQRFRLVFETRGAPVRRGGITRAIASGALDA